LESTIDGPSWQNVRDGNTRTIILAFPSSNQNVRADLLALQRAGMLSLFCTTIAWRRSRFLFQIAPHGLREELERRVFEDVEPSRIKAFPFRELVHQAARRLGFFSLTEQETGWASVDAVSKAFDEQVARLIRRRRARTAAIYAYEYAALRSFQAAGEMGMRRFYELPIGYWRVGVRLLREETELQPRWAATMELLRDSEEKRQHKDAELREADHIIVPSHFVRETLREHPGFDGTINVIPYGAPPPRPGALAGRKHSPKLRLLYVGHLSQRKGISYLFTAMERLQSEANLTLIGQRPRVDCAVLSEALKRHRWLGTMRHDRVLEVMSQHDVFVFPSLFEGFALVILEAMAQGLPVITTINSGGTMAIDHGKNGFIVPIRDPGAIVQCVSELARDRDRLVTMSKAALETAERMSWTARGSAFIAMMLARLGPGSALA